jgi:hypothetical protein
LVFRLGAAGRRSVHRHDAARAFVEEIRMQSYLEDRLSIADLMTGWIHRDLGEWDQLRNLFHPDATIEITWFAGKASDFVDGSIEMGASDFKSKHVITSPVAIFNGDKAIGSRLDVVGSVPARESACRNERT